jgi:2-dehydro-3-deoxy-D-arabinonate dehydratase
MSATALWRVTERDGTARWARGAVDGGPAELLETPTLAGLLAANDGGLADLCDLPVSGPVSNDAAVLAPLDSQPVWAAGVTFARSWEARRAETVVADVYDRVYEADRPELFVKALPGAVRGTGQRVGIRADSTWDVPEPELGLVVSPSAEIVGYVLGNDVSSRSIEGENPLYLPQAKTYEGSCAVGPCIVRASRDGNPDGAALSDVELTLTIIRGGTEAFTDTVAIGSMYRTPQDLVEWLFRACRFPTGVCLLTGTSIVPTPEFTLEPGDVVRISSEPLGVLENTVERVGES